MVVQEGGGSKFTGWQMAYGKWIGGALGWAFGGPIGGILGFAMGAMLDQGRQEVEEASSQGPRGSRHAGHTTGGDLAMSLVVLSAAVMKADGRVTRNELDHVRRFFNNQFGEDGARELLLLLRDVLQQDIPIHQVCQQVRHHMPHPIRLQLMHYLVGLAHADGRVDGAERDLLHRIGHGLGITDKDLGSLGAMFRQSDPGAAYAILEVDPKATDDEVRKAYRRMAMKYHPDKVAAMGEEFQKAATEKFRKVQEAYELIRKERGLK